MSSRSKGDQGEYEFTRAAYDELADAQKRLGLDFVTHLEASPQRGVWRFLVVAWCPAADGVDRRVASYEAVWPNSQVQSFGAFLYGCTHRCVRMAEAWRQEEDKARLVS
jgi:hypothetical protein